MNMGMMIFFSLLWPAIVLSLVIFAVRKIFFSAKTVKVGGNPLNTGYEISLCREDGVGQVFFLLAFSLLGVLLLSLNSRTGNFFERRDILFVTALAGIAGGYYFRIIYTLIAGVIAMAVWWSVEAVLWSGDSGMKPAGVFAGLLLISVVLYAAGRVYGSAGEKYRRLSSAYAILGLTAIISAFFFFSTKPGLRTFYEILKGFSPLSSPKMLASLSFFLSFSLFSLFYGFKRKAFLAVEGVFLLLLALFFFTMPFLPQKELFADAGGYDFFKKAVFTRAGLSWAVFFNAGIFFESVGIIFLGYFRKEDRVINLGAFLVSLLIFVKYFDWFFDFMDKSFFFLGAGILLFGLGWFMERGRKYMLASIRKEN